MAILSDVSHGAADGNAAHIGRTGVDSLQTHSLSSEVQSAQSFGMGDHTGQHYHAVDALSSNVLPGGGRDRIPPPEPQTKPPSTKRRKINTCYPCKQRKVKCDRQHPYCGQCQKHRIPAERCVWSSDMSMPSDMHSPTALQFSKPDNGHAMGLGSDWAGAHGTEIALDNDTRAVIERISHLEQRLSTASSQTSHDIQGTTASSQAQIDPLLLGTTLSLGDVNPERSNSALSQDAAVAAELAFWRAKMEQHHRPTHSGDGTQMAQMQAEQNIAADALAMFARHSQHGQLGTSDQAGLGRAGENADAESLPRQNIVSALFDSAAFSLGNATQAPRVRAALDQLPDNQQMDYLLKILQTVDLHVSYGISWRLVKMQLTNLRSQIANWTRMQSTAPDNIDLSFLALLLVLLALAAQYTEPRFFIEQGFCTTTDQIGSVVDSWIDTAQSLMAMDDFVNKTNWNHIAALLLSVDHHAARGKLCVCLTTVSILVRLAELQGYQTLGSAKDDEEQWKHSPASKQVCLSAVVGVPSTSAGRPTKPFINLATSLPDRSHLVREAARRLWYKIACKDMILSTVFNRASTIDTSRVTTKFPLNVDEDELPDGETHLLPHIKEDGRATINNLTPYVYEIAELGRQWGDALRFGIQSYDPVLEYDAKFRSLLASLPVFLRPDPALEQLPEVRQEQLQRPYLAMHRLIIFEAVNHQLLMLHRDDMCRGHHDEKYAYSTRVAVDAARTIISCRQQIDNVHPSVQRHSVFRHHLFQAAIVLSLHLLELTRKSQGSSQVAHQLRDDIALIMNYLTEANDVNGAMNTQLPQSQKVAIKLVETLVAEELAQQQGGTRKTESPSADKTLQGSSDSVGGISLYNNNSNSLFQLAPSEADTVNDAANAFASQMLDSRVATSAALSELFASLDELMVPIY
ncbi:hypothetical protein MVES1_002999 [Malassezia vespertilionis]|nr:uncharacterized protein MVES1_002999 [Malassezia vespertilionis]WFD07630.1 hypothetical protein MVES1_002999 [Malassezia vespertilionis]